MRPLIWRDRRALAVAGFVVGWAASIELGTSRRASREAARSVHASETVIDTTTSRLFDGAAAAALGGGIAASIARPQTSIRHQRLAYTAGLALLVASGLLSTVARRHLGRFHRASLTAHGDHQLVETGPYRRVRHPLYAATIGAFAGIGAILGNRLSLSAAVLPALALVHRIRVEEEMLVNALGATYTRYSERTARLVPGLW